MPAVNIAIRYLPHALAAVVAAGAFAGLPYSFLPVGLLFLAAPLIEFALGEERGSRQRAGRAERVSCQLAPWLWLPLQATVLVAGVCMLRETPDPQAAVRLAIPAGMLSGMFGMAAAHELMHRNGRAARYAAAFLLATSGYGHFFIEHVRGHHMRVGTPADAATAKLGECLYSFLLRTVAGGLSSAWAFEVDRLRRRGLRALGPRNRLLGLAALSSLLCATAGLAVGPAGALFFAVQALVSIATLEVVNYIQHYGLVRRAPVPGSREHLAAAHTWDCAFRLTNLLLCDLGRHADHHARPARRSDELEARADGPRLPAGYFTMFILALLPPLWAQIMNPRAQLAHARFERQPASWPAQPTAEETS